MSGDANYSSSLTSLAMLSLQLDSGKDYLDYLRGFIIRSLRVLDGEAIDARSVKKVVENEFGLNIPAATFAICLKRLNKEGLVKRDKHDQFYSVDKLPDQLMEPLRKKARNHIATVTDELAGYAYVKFNLQWDDRHSAEALASFLKQYSIDFLKFSEARSPLPFSADSPQNAAYVVASFISTMAKERLDVFEGIKVLVQSHILANALMCPDLEGTARGLKGVHFLVDTRFVIKLLDLESELDTQNARALVLAIQQLKGVVCIFQETKDELQSVLTTVVQKMQQGTAHGAMSRELRKRHKGVADVILKEQRLGDELKKFLITMYPSPSYSEDSFQFQIDEKELRDAIEEEIEYITDHAVQHDVRVVRHIVALRKGRRVRSIEDAGFVFLTTNSGLSRAAFNYEFNNSDGRVFSPVVTDFHLSHLVWLKSPLTLPDLPRSEILASCYAAMKPRKEVWSRYVEEVDRLKNEGVVTERDHEVLRLSVNAPEALMDVTQGDVEGVNSSNIQRILRNLEKTYAAKKEARLAEEAAAHEKTRITLESTKATLARAEDKVKDHDRAKEEISTLKKEQALQKKKEQERRIRVHGIADRISVVVYVLVWVAVVGFGVLSFLNSWSFWFSVPFVILGVLNLAAGFSGKKIKEWVHKKTESYLLDFIS